MGLSPSSKGIAPYGSLWATWSPTSRRRWSWLRSCGAPDNLPPPPPLKAPRIPDTTHPCQSHINPDDDQPWACARTHEYCKLPGRRVLEDILPQLENLRLVRLKSLERQANPLCRCITHPTLFFQLSFSPTNFMAVVLNYLGVVVAVAIVIRLLMSGRRPKNLPPGPPTLPIIGNLHLVCPNLMRTPNGALANRATDA